jgi:hypothetical protein
MKAEVEASKDEKAHAEAAVLAMIPLNLKVSEFRKRLAEKEAALSTLQVCCTLSYAHCFLCAAGQGLSPSFCTLPASPVYTVWQPHAAAHDSTHPQAVHGQKVLR